MTCALDTTQYKLPVPALHLNESYHTGCIVYLTIRH